MTATPPGARPRVRKATFIESNLMTLADSMPWMGFWLGIPAAILGAVMLGTGSPVGALFGGFLVGIGVWLAFFIASVFLDRFVEGLPSRHQRMKRRERAGACGKCGYPVVAERADCPECGQAYLNRQAAPESASKPAAAARR